MTIFTLGLIMVVFAVGGFAVDIQRFDHERARLQYSLDRAVLAATDLRQDLCPTVVIKDYLEKENLGQYLIEDEIIIEPANLCGSSAVTIEGFRRVQARAEMDVAMHFMQWWDVDYITTSVFSAAEEALGNVEISMVLDVSGSMNSNSRLTTLKLAAQEFVQEMVDKSEDGKMSISIVPYATQVALPDSMMDYISTSGVNPHANCINFTSSQFQDGEFDLNLVYDRTLHFTPWYTYDQRSKEGEVLVYNEICETDENRQAMVFQKDADLLKNKIASFEAAGNTSIDLGVKWGMALLDDSMQPVIAQMAAAGDVPAEFATRPDNPRSGDTLKVMILMTDGANTTQYLTNYPYRDGKSGVWWNEGLKDYVSYAELDENDEITIEFGTNYIWRNVDMIEWDEVKRFYWARDRLQPSGYGNTIVNNATLEYENVDSVEAAEAVNPEGSYVRGFIQYRCLSISSSGDCVNFDRDTKQVKTYHDLDVEPSKHLTWPDLWEQTSRRKLREYFRNYYGYSWGTNFYNDAVSSNGRSIKDPRVRSMCDYAKDQMGVVIFTISLEAPSAGRAIMQHCKTADATYYEANPDDLPDVFASITASIRNLRLTQ
ncbi:Tad domain-containing protein [Ruegeria sp. SCPT10]|uniref:Tad domain-containing protein n=1 Tax=Ruegeria sp. SCP10 TaxID=3141377 RepID=UPI0033393422